jgi:hypothetical protein
MELEKLFIDIIKNFPNQFGEDNITLSETNLLLNETNYSSDKIIIIPGIHWYDVNRIDQFTVYSNYENYRLLGLLILAVIFNDKQKEFKISLSNSKSQIREIRIRNEVKNLDIDGLHIKPHLFNYYPQKIKRHPFLNLSDVSRYDFPYIELNNKEENIINEDDLKNRDVLIIKGNYLGNARLAELLINFSYENQEIEEVNLENDLGFGGVAPGSAELSLYSPKVSWFIDP